VVKGEMIGRSTGLRARWWKSEGRLAAERDWLDQGAPPPPVFLNKSAETIEDAGDGRDMRNERVRKLLKGKSGVWKRRAEERVKKLD